MTRKNESTTDLGSFLCALFGVAIVVLLPEHGAMATEGAAEDSGREESNSSAPADARLPADLAPFFLPPRELTGDFGEYRSPLTFYDGRTVENAADWDERRREILGRWHEIMGAWPPLIEKPEITYLDKERRENLAQHRIRLEVAPGGRTVEGYLRVPDGKGPFPAVVVVYYDAKTGIGLGKELRFGPRRLLHAPGRTLAKNAGDPAMVRRRDRRADPHSQGPGDAFQDQRANVLPRLAATGPTRRCGGARLPPRRPVQARFRGAAHRIRAESGSGRHAPDREQRRVGVRGVPAPCVPSGVERRQ